MSFTCTPRIRQSFLKSPVGPWTRPIERGKSDKFGVSNYTVKEVELIVEICKVQGWGEPTMYEGRYDAIIRSGEKRLTSTLRKHWMSMYAYMIGVSPFLFAMNFRALFRLWETWILLMHKIR